MSGFVSEQSGIAASVFLAIYTLFMLFMIYVVSRKGLKTVFTFILIFTIFRFVSQLCGTVFAKVGPSNINWLVAYLVFGAEGYFTLILASVRFSCRAQVEKFGSSWALKSGPGKRPSFLRIFHLILVPANALVIAGGSMLTGIDPSDMANETNKVNTSKALRTVGQVLFVLMTFTAVSFNLYIFIYERIRNRITISVMAAGPFLLVRGIFGILSIYVSKMNYYDLENYSGDGIGHSLVVYEYVLSTTMEFIAAVCLINTYFHPPTPAAYSDGDSEQNFVVEEK